MRFYMMVFQKNIMTNIEEDNAFFIKYYNNSCLFLPLLNTVWSFSIYNHFRRRSFDQEADWFWCYFENRLIWNMWAFSNTSVFEITSKPARLWSKPAYWKNSVCYNISKTNKFVWDLWRGGFQLSNKLYGSVILKLTCKILLISLKNSTNICYKHPHMRR